MGNLAQSSPTIEQCWNNITAMTCNFFSILSIYQIMTENETTFANP